MYEEASTSALLPKSSVGHLIRKLMVMCKKPSVDSDLGEILDEYLRILKESQIYLNNGIFTINFTEGALLLNNAVILYAKKIDLMWDYVLDYNKRMLTFEKKTEKTRQAELQLEERRQKYKRVKRKNKVQVEDDIDESAMDSLIENVLNRLDEDPLVTEDLSLEDDENVIRNCDDICSKFLPKQTATMPIALYNRAGYTTTSYKIFEGDECVCNNNQLASERMMFLLPEHTRQIAYNLYKKRNIELIGYDVRDKLLQRYIVEKNATHLEATEINAYIKIYLDIHKKHNTDLMAEHKKSCMRRRSSIMLTRLPDSVVHQYLKDDDTVDSISQSGESTDSDEVVTKRAEPEETVKTTITPPPIDFDLEDHLRNAENEKNQSESGTQQTVSSDSGFFDTSVLDAASQCDDEMIDQCENDDCNVYNDRVISEDEVVTSTPKSAAVMAKEKQNKMLTRSSEEKPKRKLYPDYVVNDNDDDDDEMELPKKAKRQRTNLFRWLPTTSAKLKTFEKFYYGNYEPEEGEGHAPDCAFSDSEDERETNTELPSTVVYSDHTYAVCPIRCIPEENLTDPEQHAIEISTTDQSKEPSTITEEFTEEPSIFDDQLASEPSSPIDHLTTTEPSTSNDQILIEAASTSHDSLSATEPSTSAAAMKNLEEIITKKESKQTDSDRFFLEFLQAKQAEQAQFFEWKNFIENKIASNEQTDFDIYKYGADIMTQLPEKQPMHFTDLVSRKKPSEVVRYFIASLQLGYTNNVELTHSNEMQLGNDDLRLTLLTKERYHENLAAYHAPSEENLRKNLARVRALTRATSTSNHSPQKKRKLNL